MGRHATLGVCLKMISLPEATSGLNDARMRTLSPSLYRWGRCTKSSTRSGTASTSSCPPSVRGVTASLTLTDAARVCLLSFSRPVSALSCGGGLLAVKLLAVNFTPITPCSPAPRSRRRACNSRVTGELVSSSTRIRLNARCSRQVPTLRLPTNTHPPTPSPTNAVTHTPTPRSWYQHAWKQASKALQ
jgi:hypothetical protein